MTNVAAGRSAPGRETQMFGRYRLLGRLAAGGMAEVWAAQLLAAGGFCKAMVIKRVLPELAENPSFLRMLMQEARVAARLSHSNICSVFELGEVDGEYYIAMEYLRGAPLTALLKAGGKVPPEAAAAIVAQACDGLHYAHEQRDSGGNLLQLVHRDVSPHNLFVTVDGIVKVLDFGIAKVDDGSGEHTEAGKVKGKLSYMSPEQLAAQPLDRRSDVWSLGVVLWELLTGRRLFGGASPAFTVDAIRNARIPALASAGADAPQFDEVLTRAMCRSREWRFGNAGELRNAIVEALKPIVPAPSDALSQLVWARCGKEIRAHDRMFEDEEPPAPGVVDRLPLKAGEVTQPSYDVEIVGVEAIPEAVLRRGRSRQESAAVPTVVEPLGGGPRHETIDTVDLGYIRPDTSPEVDAINSDGEDTIDGNDRDAETPTPPPRASVDPSGVIVAPAWSVPEPRPGRGHLVIAALAGIAVLAVAWLVVRGSGEDAGSERATGGPTDRPALAEPAPVAVPDPDVEPEPKVEPRPEPEPKVEPRPEPKVAKVEPEPRDESRPEPKVEPKPEPKVAKVEPKPERKVAKVEPEPRDEPERKVTKPAAAKPGRLSIDARPWATIYLDGKELGVTPLGNVPVPAGDHTIKAVGQDGQTRTMKIHVEPGGEVRRRVKW